MRLDDKTQCCQLSIIISKPKLRTKSANQCREQTVYKLSAIAASTAVIALAVAAVHYRFTWHMKQGHEFPTAEALATFCLTIGGIVRFLTSLEQTKVLSAHMTCTS